MRSPALLVPLLLLGPLLSLGSAPPPSLASAVAAPDRAWQSPLHPLIVERPFLAPSGPYAPGHRGADLAASPGAIVRAPASGVVRVAGRVALKAVISIEHPHVILGRTGWRTTYEGVLAGVTVGDRVHTGDPIGVVILHAHSGGIHWGLKNGRAYADPLRLLRRPVVLKPLHKPLALRAGTRVAAAPPASHSGPSAGIPTVAQVDHLTLADALDQTTCATSRPRRACRSASWLGSRDRGFLAQHEGPLHLRGRE